MARFKLSKWVLWAVLTVSAVGFALSAIATPLPADALVGGTPVSAGERPYFVKVESPLGECGGAMLSPEWVITARHCVAKGDASNVTMTAGWTANGVGAPKRIVGIEAVWHPAADLALVRVPATNGVPTVKLTDSPLRAGDTYLSVGAGDGSGDRLTQARFRLDWAGGYYEFTAKGATGTEANCHGDSGSPAIVETPDGDHLVGVSTAISPTDCSLGSRTWVVNVWYPATKDWLTTTMR